LATETKVAEFAPTFFSLLGGRICPIARVTENQPNEFMRDEMIVLKLSITSDPSRGSVPDKEAKIKKDFRALILVCLPQRE
jgi:hypothetical protein